MLNLEVFANILEKEGYGKIGQDIFINNFPDGKNGILILPQNYGNKNNKYIPGYYNDSGFQIIVRNKSFESGQKIAYNIMETLEIMQSKQVENLWVNQCYARTLPKSYAVSDGNVVEHSLDFHLNFIDTKSFAREE